MVTEIDILEQRGTEVDVEAIKHLEKYVIHIDELIGELPMGTPQILKRYINLPSQKRG